MSLWHKACARMRTSKTTTDRMTRKDEHETAHARGLNEACGTWRHGRRDGWDAQRLRGLAWLLLTS